METRRAVALLSGGIDSTTATAAALREGFLVHALTFDYGQRNRLEIDRARLVAKELGVTAHVVVSVDMSAFGGSALTGDLAVPKDRAPEMIGQDIPITYVPARNTIFLSVALAWAEVLNSSDIFTGMNVLDYGGYPDCRPEFFKAYERMADLATRAGVEGRQHLKIHAPLLRMTKAEIIRYGIDLGVDFALTMSCYDPSPADEACGACDACVLRLRGFAQAGFADPITYQTRPAAKPLRRARRADA